MTYICPRGSTHRIVLRHPPSWPFPERAPLHRPCPRTVPRFPALRPSVLFPAARWESSSTSPFVNRMFSAITPGRESSTDAAVHLSFRALSVPARLRVEFPRPAALRRGFRPSVLVPPTVCPQKILSVGCPRLAPGLGSGDHSLLGRPRQMGTKGEKTCTSIALNSLASWQRCRNENHPEQQGRHDPFAGDQDLLSEGRRAPRAHRMAPHRGLGQPRQVRRRVPQRLSHLRRGRTAQPRVRKQRRESAHLRHRRVRDHQPAGRPAQQRFSTQSRRGRRIGGLPSLQKPGGFGDGKPCVRAAGKDRTL